MKEITTTAGWRHKSGIYVFLNLVTGKVYVGSTCNIKSRILARRLLSGAPPPRKIRTISQSHRLQIRETVKKKRLIKQPELWPTL